MTDTKATGTPKPPARPTKPPVEATKSSHPPMLALPGPSKPQPKVRKMVKPPEPVKPDSKSKPKRGPQRTKLAGWEKGTVRSACFYVQDNYHQAVNLAASALRVSKGIVVERAVRDYLKAHPGLDGVRVALAAVVGFEWDQGDEVDGSDG